MSSIIFPNGLQITQDNCLEWILTQLKNQFNVKNIKEIKTYNDFIDLYEKRSFSDFVGFEKEIKILKKIERELESNIRKTPNSFRYCYDRRMECYGYVKNNTELDLIVFYDMFEQGFIFPLASVEPVFSEIKILEKLKKILFFRSKSEDIMFYEEENPKNTLDPWNNLAEGLGTLYCKKGIKTQLIAELMEELEKEIETNV
jgi:hypothetical protein